MLLIIPAPKKNNKTNVGLKKRFFFQPCLSLTSFEFSSSLLLEYGRLSGRQVDWKTIVFLLSTVQGSLAINPELSSQIKQILSFLILIYIFQFG